MGAGPSTGDGCEFPFANTTSAPDCSLTCAEALGPTYDAITGLMLCVSSISFLYFLYILKFILKDIQQSRDAMMPTPSSKALKNTLEFWLFSGLAVFFVILTNIDPRGWAGIMPAEVAEILTNCIIVSIICVAVALADFWIRSVSRSGSEGLMYRKMFYVVIWINFLGMSIAAAIFPEWYFLLDGIKLLVGSMLVLVIMIKALFPIRMMLEIMSEAKQSNSETSKKSIWQIKRKFFIFYFVVLVANSALVGTGFQSILRIVNQPDLENPYEWVIECKLSISMIISRIFQLVMCMIVFIFFNPRTQKQRQSANLSKGGPNQASHHEASFSSKSNTTRFTTAKTNSKNALLKKASELSMMSSNSPRATMLNEDALMSSMASSESANPLYQKQ